MYFLDKLLSDQTRSLRQKLVNHLLWKKIGDGTLEKKHLGIFALQDYWLVRQARRIDGLTLAAVKNKQLQNLLIKRLSNDHSVQGTIIDFGLGVGLNEKDFDDVTPLPGCMALTTFFYWMILNTSDAEIVAAIMASIAIFDIICLNIYKPLMENYKLSNKQVGFFKAHKFSEQYVSPISEFIERNYCKKEEVKLIEKAVQLSHAYELMFYDTIVNITFK